MPLTMEDVIQLEVMRGVKVRTARNELSRRPVESISVIEIPVENFVRKNEFVLSTAVGCGPRPDLFMNFVREVLDSGAAAMGLAIGPHLSFIPEEVLRLAENRRVPLLEIPWETRFSDIFRTVLRELEKGQNHLSALSEEVQKQFLQMILDGKDLSAIVSAASRLLGHPILLVDSRGNIKGSSAHRDLINLWSSASPQASPLFVSGPLDSLPGLSRMHWRCFQLGDIPCLEVPIRSGRKRQGSLLCFLPRDTDVDSFLNQEMIVVLEHAAMAAALWFRQENMVLETELRLRSDFVWSLAKGEIRSEEIIHSRAKSLGYDATVPYACILGRVETNGEVSESRSADFAEQLQQHTMRTLEDMALQTARTLQRKVMTAFQRDELVIFLEVPPDRVVDTVHTFFDLFEGRLKEQLPGCFLSWGVGENRAGILTFHAGYNDARTALEIGRKQKGPGHRSFFVDTGLYRALSHLCELPDMCEIVWTAIGRLIEYSRQRGIDLIQTFNAYVRNHCNVSQTARELNLHRQSLLYRLRKIESLTGRSLSDPDDLFLLQLSIKIWTTRSDILRKHSVPSNAS